MALEPCGGDVGFDFTGVYAAVKVRAGDTFKIPSEFTLDTGLTITAAAVTVYDVNGTAVSGITETAAITGSTVEWGLLSSSETTTLSYGEDYTYVFRITLSNGIVQTAYYGPLFVSPAHGGGSQQ